MSSIGRAGVWIRPRALRVSLGWATGLMGLCLVCLFFWLQPAWSDLAGSDLAALQHLTWYPYVSGAFLLALICPLWHLAYLRAHQRPATRRHVKTHQWIGALTPFALLLHTTRVGYGYTRVLSLTLLGSCLVGLLAPRYLRVRAPWFFAVWMMLHIVLAFVLLAGIGLHLFVVTCYH